MEYQGIKTIGINARMRYPIVSAYEFEFLKTEAEVQALLKPCTIYFILQRPLLTFENVRMSNGEISFTITDGSATPSLTCTLVPWENSFCHSNDDDVFVEVQYYKKVPDKEEPYNNVAALKFLSTGGDFLGWFSPAKFLYSYLVKSLKATVNGPILEYLDYTVHYIGQSFSQNVWDRLTGHEKMQSILTLEEPLRETSRRAPFEISLLMLDIVGFEEANMFPFDGAMVSGIEPIIHKLRDDDDGVTIGEFLRPKLERHAPELTNEVEALLISTFQPAYNEVLFNNYPKIKSGTRSAGYSQSELCIAQMPVILKTAEHVQELVLRDDDEEDEQSE